MKVLVACEESQTVCKAFRARGHEAYSCDLQEPSGGHPEWHILGDALEAMRGGWIKTMEMEEIFIDKWDLMIAHPPCTHLAVSGARYFSKKQKDGRQQKAIVFFMECALQNIDKIAVENPVCIMSSAWRKPDQIIQPYEYGHPTRKSTCLWLKNLPNLKPTHIVKPEIHKYGFGEGFDMCRDENGKILSWNDPRTAKLRSKTFEGIAKAMAEQWG